MIPLPAFSTAEEAKEWFLNWTLDVYFPAGNEYHEAVDVLKKAGLRAVTCEAHVMFHSDDKPSRQAWVYTTDGRTIWTVKKTAAAAGMIELIKAHAEQIVDLRIAHAKYMIVTKSYSDYWAQVRGL